MMIAKLYACLLSGTSGVNCRRLLQANHNSGIVQRNYRTYFGQLERKGHVSIERGVSAPRQGFKSALPSTISPLKAGCRLLSTQTPVIEVKRQKLKPTKRQIVTLTERAIEQLSRIAGDANKIVKLFFVVKGCNGYSYEMQLVDSQSLDTMDEIVNDGSGKPVLAIENKAVFHLLGCHIDYQVSQLEEGFTFDNPNVTSKCGCGQSFQF